MSPNGGAGPRARAGGWGARERRSHKQVRSATGPAGSSVEYACTIEVRRMQTCHVCGCKWPLFVCVCVEGCLDVHFALISDNGTQAR